MPQAKKENKAFNVSKEKVKFVLATEGIRFETVRVFAATVTLRRIYGLNNGVSVATNAASILIQTFRLIKLNHI